MPQEQQQQRRATEQVPGELPRREQDAALDAVLDRIDEVLQADAEAFVKSFVQKGGQ